MRRSPLLPALALTLALFALAVACGGDEPGAVPSTSSTTEVAPTTTTTMPTGSTVRDATIGVELSPEMEAFVAAAEDVCIRRLPLSSTSDPDERVAFVRASVVLAAEKVAGLEAVPIPPEATDVAEAYVITPYRLAHQAVREHEEELVAAARVSLDELLRVSVEVRSRYVPNLEGDREAWVRANGIGDCVA